MSFALRALCILLVFAPALPAFAQRAIVLRSAGPSPYQEASDAFRARYGNAQEVLVGAADTQLADRVRAMDPDIVFAIGPTATELSRRFLEDVPVVSAFTPAPTDLGTGVYIEPEIPAAVQLQRIKDTLPKRTKLGIMFDPDKTLARVEQFETAASSRGIEIVRIPVRRAREIGPAFREISGDIDALLFIPDSTVTTKGNVKDLLRRCIVEKVPAIGYTPWFSDNGAVLSLSIDYRGLGEQAADQAKNAPDAGGLVVSPTAVIATYNMRVASKLNVVLDVDLDDPTVRTID